MPKTSEHTISMSSFNEIARIRCGFFLVYRAYWAITQMGAKIVRGRKGYKACARICMPASRAAPRACRRRRVEQARGPTDECVLPVAMPGQPKVLSRGSSPEAIRLICRLQACIRGHISRSLLLRSEATLNGHLAAMEAPALVKVRLRWSSGSPSKRPGSPSKRPGSPTNRPGGRGTFLAGGIVSVRAGLEVVDDDYEKLRRSPQLAHCDAAICTALLRSEMWNLGIADSHRAANKIRRDMERIEMHFCVTDRAIRKLLPPMQKEELSFGLSNRLRLLRRYKEMLELGASALTSEAAEVRRASFKRAVRHRHQHAQDLHAAEAAQIAEEAAHQAAKRRKAQMRKILSYAMTHIRSNRAIRISVTTQQAMAAITIQRFVRERKWNRDQMHWAKAALARTAQTDSTVCNLSFALRFAPQRTRLLQREAAFQREQWRTPSQPRTRHPRILETDVEMAERQQAVAESAHRCAFAAQERAASTQRARQPQLNAGALDAPDEERPTTPPSARGACAARPANTAADGSRPMRPVRLAPVLYQSATGPVAADAWQPTRPSSAKCASATLSPPRPVRPSSAQYPSQAQRLPTRPVRPSRPHSARSDQSTPIEAAPVAVAYSARSDRSAPTEAALAAVPVFPRPAQHATGSTLLSRPQRPPSAIACVSSLAFHRRMWVQTPGVRDLVEEASANALRPALERMESQLNQSKDSTMASLLLAQRACCEAPSRIPERESLTEEHIRSVVLVNPRADRNSHLKSATARQAVAWMDSTMRSAHVKLDKASLARWRAERRMWVRAAGVRKRLLVEEAKREEVLARKHEKDLRGLEQRMVRWQHEDDAAVLIQLVWRWRHGMPASRSAEVEAAPVAAAAPAAPAAATSDSEAETTSEAKTTAEAEAEVAEARAASVSAETERKAEANLRAEVESAESERAKRLTLERVELEADGVAAETAKASTQPHLGLKFRGIRRLPFQRRAPEVPALGCGAYVRSFAGRAAPAPLAPKLCTPAVPARFFSTVAAVELKEEAAEQETAEAMVDPSRDLSTVCKGIHWLMDEALSGFDYKDTENRQQDLVLAGRPTWRPPPSLPPRPAAAVHVAAPLARSAACSKARTRTPLNNLTCSLNICCPVAVP